MDRNELKTYLSLRHLPIVYSKEYIECIPEEVRRSILKALEYNTRSMTDRGVLVVFDNILFIFDAHQRSNNGDVYNKLKEVYENTFIDCLMDYYEKM